MKEKRRRKREKERKKKKKEKRNKIALNGSIIYTGQRIKDQV